MKLHQVIGVKSWFHLVKLRHIYPKKDKLLIVKINISTGNSNGNGYEVK